MKSWFTSLKIWLQTEPTTRDRVTTAMMEFWAGLWFGVIFAFIYSNPASASLLFWSALGGAIACAIIGGIFPKYPRILFLPFCFFSIGGN